NDAIIGKIKAIISFIKLPFFHHFKKKYKESVTKNIIILSLNKITFITAKFGRNDTISNKVKNILLFFIIFSKIFLGNKIVNIPNNTFTYCPIILCSPKR